MGRKQLSLRPSPVIVAALALTVSSIAFADDNSMSRLTGDSYAYFNNLDYNPGKFNTARAPSPDDGNATAKAPQVERNKVEQRILLATRPSRSTVASPFRDDTGA